MPTDDARPTLSQDDMRLARNRWLVVRQFDEYEAVLTVRGGELFAQIRTKSSQNPGGIFEEMRLGDGAW